MWSRAHDIVTIHRISRQGFMIVLVFYILYYKVMGAGFISTSIG